MAGELTGRVLYCDEHCVVVNKIIGEAVEGAGKGMADLPQLLAAELASPDYPVPEAALPLPTAVHRLDVPVTGCILFARSETALGFLNAAFSGETVKKRYWAITEPSSHNELAFEDSGEIPLVHWLQFDPRRNKSTAHDQPGPGRKKAILRCRLAGRGQNYLFLEIDLITGRHHQIRAQLERAGLRIKGDLKYGARRSEPNGGIRLHARSLSFPVPAGGSKTAQADPPLIDNLWQAFMESALGK